MATVTEPAKNTGGERTDRRGRAVFKFKFTQGLSVIKFIGKELEASGPIQ